MNEQDIIYRRVNAGKEKVTVPAEKSHCPLMCCSLTVMADASAIFVLFLQLARFVGTQEKLRFLEERKFDVGIGMFLSDL